MNRKTADTYYKSKRLNRYGFDADPNRVRIGRSETPLHVCARFLCGYVLQNANPSRAWDVECVVNKSGDRVDCLDFGTFEEEPLAIEFESNPTRQSIEEKVEKYVINGPCRDVLPLDLRDAPADVDGIVAWLQTEVPGVVREVRAVVEALRERELTDEQARELDRLELKLESSEKILDIARELR